MKDSKARISEQQQRFYEFGPFRLDALKGLLLRDRTPVPLPRKAFVTLLILAQNSGQVVSKDELMRRIWPDTIVEENNLAQRISQVRKALSENTKDHEYIVTAPGHGYCFVARVKKICEETGEPLDVVESNIVVLEKGGRVRVSVQLLSVKDGKPLWARNFDAQFTDIFPIQDSISEQVVSSLMIELTDETHGFLTKHHTDSPEAYPGLLEGTPFLEQEIERGAK